MADSYTKFSLILKLPDIASQQYALALNAKAHSLTTGEDVPGEIPESLHHWLEEWIFTTRPSGNELEPAIWIYSEDGGVDAACEFIHHLLKKFNLEGYVAFEWSHDCSKPLVDAYGGGAAFITADDIHTMSTWEWIIEKSRQCSQP